MVQMHMMPTSETVKITSQARIIRLEKDVSSLWTVVRNLEAKLGYVPSAAAASPQPPSSSQTESAGGSYEKPRDDDSDSDASNLSPTNTPSHLLQLFDNGLLGSDGSESATARHAPGFHKAQRCVALRKLMPSRKDMITITAHASSWLFLYNALFPMANLMKTSEEMLAQYDKLQHPDADPVAIAALLLSIALTVQQAPDETTGRAVESIKDASSFIKDASDSVERTVILDDALVGNLEGIETALLFIRL